MSSSESSTVPPRGPHRQDKWTDVRLVPMARLEWSLTTEDHPRAASAASPADLRGSWLHTAPEERVLGLFRQLGGTASTLPAPWWLRALDRGDLDSRASAFEIEDGVHALLSARPGWVFVPWADVGETGYWEYGPSDSESMRMPTTVLLTDRHRGWVRVIPAHAEAAPPPWAVDGVAGLATVLDELESA